MRSTAEVKLSCISRAQWLCQFGIDAGFAADTGIVDEPVDASRRGFGTIPVMARSDRVREIGAEA